MASPSTAAPEDSKRQAARQVIDILHEISVLLNTSLDRTQLSLCVSLIENGVNPEALANVIRELRKEANNTNAEAAGGLDAAGGPQVRNRSTMR